MHGEAGVKIFATLLAERILILRGSNDQVWFELYEAVRHDAHAEFPAPTSDSVENQ